MMLMVEVTWWRVMRKVVAEGMASHRIVVKGDTTVGSSLRLMFQMMTATATS